MGTRGCYGFYKSGVTKATYNHYDSYPDYLGLSIANDISKATNEEWNDIFDKIIMVDENDKPTQEQIEECQEWLNLDVSTQCADDWYCLLRDAQGDIEAFTKGLKYMIEYSSFINSLMCEYIYIINLDTNELEFYIGGCDKFTYNRYNDHVFSGEEFNEYFRRYCRHLKSFPLDFVREDPEAVVLQMNEAVNKEYE